MQKSVDMDSTSYYYPGVESGREKPRWRIIAFDNDGQVSRQSLMRRALKRPGFDIPLRCAFRASPAGEAHGKTLADFFRRILTWWRSGRLRDAR